MSQLKESSRKTSSKPSEKPRLTYWHGFGRGECIRMCLVGADIEFEDIGLQSSEEFASLQPKLAWGQVPLLEIDGLNLVQTVAAIQYLGRRFDMYGDNIDEQYEIDTNVGALNDFYGAIIGYPFREDPTELLATLKGKLVEKYIRRWEQRLEGKTWLVGTRLSIADCLLFAYMRFAIAINDGDRSWVSECPNVLAHFDRISALPRVKKYIQSEKKLPWSDYKKVVRGTLSRA